jgi:hypothetical protein
VTWENDVTGVDYIATHMVRTGNQNEFLYRAVNATDTGRSIDWAVVALVYP